MGNEVIGDEFGGTAMMMWYGGDLWGWCGVIVNVVAVAVFLGAIIAAIALAVRFGSGGRSDLSAPRDGGSTRAEAVLAARGAPGRMDNDEFHRRLM
jgi:putative membrane protein